MDHTVSSMHCCCPCPTSNASCLRSKLGLLAVNNRPSTSGVVQLFLIPHDLYRLKEEIRGAAAWANVRCFGVCWLKLLWIWMERKLYTTVFREDLELTRFSTSIFSIRHMWPNVSFLTRKQPCLHRACSSRRINYVWKEEASNFQCTNTLFALSFVFVLLWAFNSSSLYSASVCYSRWKSMFSFPTYLEIFFLWHAQFLIVCSNAVTNTRTI